MGQLLCGTLGTPQPVSRDSSTGRGCLRSACRAAALHKASTWRARPRSCSSLHNLRVCPHEPWTKCAGTERAASAKCRGHTQSQSLLATSQGSLRLPCEAAQRGWQTPQGGKPASRDIALLSATCSSSGLSGPVMRERCPLSTKAQQRAGEQCRQGSPGELLSPIRVPQFTFSEGCQGRRTEWWERQREIP